MSGTKTISGRCRCCRRSRAADPRSRHWARGYCGGCYDRWRKRGFPAEGPPAVSARAARLEDYGDLRSFGLSPEAAARRLGVSARTAWRYEAELRHPHARGAA